MLPHADLITTVQMFINNSSCYSCPIYIIKKLSTSLLPREFFPLCLETDILSAIFEF